MTDLVKNWFAEEFSNLHPLIQQLHIDGGTLSGDIELSYGTGLAGLIGSRLGSKLGLPDTSGKHKLSVTISHHEKQLIWSREFDHGRMVSVFTPVGVYPTGYWCEKTGLVELRLGVSIVDGGWHWRQQKMKFRSAPVPRFLYPQTQAYKKIVDGKYEFGVALSYPFAGTLVEYKGVLEAVVRGSSTAIS